MGKSAKKSKATTPPKTGWPPERYVQLSVVAVSILVVGTGILTDQIRGAVLTEIQVLAVGAACWWGLRR